MKKIGGLWWPDQDLECHGAVLSEGDNSIPQALKHVENFRHCVQAGGNVGVFPLALAKKFEIVTTFEPDPDNFLCLLRNIADVKNICALEAALGRSAGTCSIVHKNETNVGAHYVDPDGKGIKMLAIDSLQIYDCDLIWLDIEGFEIPALQGAENTILRCLPVIVVEDKGLSDKFGYKQGEVATYLEKLGYKKVDAFGRDVVFKFSK